MNKKIIATLIVLLFCACCLSIVSADNSTNETLQSNESELDMSNYVLPVSVSDSGIEFSDGFTGFYLDLTNDSITTNDKFVSQSTGSDGIQNYVKLAILEAYRQGCEHDLTNIINIFASGSYEDSNNKVVVAVLKSDETIGDSAIVDLDDSIEGDFEFELLKDADGKKSDCIAYKVSLKELPEEDKLAANGANITAESNVTDDDASDDNETADPQDNETDDNQDENKTADATGNKTEEKSVDESDNKTDDNKQNNETTVTETNKTIINKTNTVTINENNTTTINVNNNKVINKTNETPQNATIQDAIVKTVGNPIFILIVVFAILAATGIYMRRKGN